MKLTKGMYSDCAPVDQPAGTYAFAKNVVATNVLGALENEKGFIDLGTFAPYTIIGIVPTGNSFAVFSTNNTNCEIGSWSNGTYSAVYNSPDLAFNTAHPIKGEFRKDLNGDRIVAFIDDINKPRIINLDNPSISNIQDINIFQNLQNPTIGSYSIQDTGGALLTGAYVIMTKYASADGSTETDWFVHDKVFYINDDSKTVPFQEDDGCVAGSPSSKSITVNFDNCDTAFEKLKIGYLYVQAGVVTPYESTTKDLASSVAVTITGNETAIKISLEEALTSRAEYINAKAISQINGQLLLGNLKTDALPNLQAVACGIHIDWINPEGTGHGVTVKQNSGRHKDTLPCTFIPGEVYAFYLGVELLNGQRAFYHIPGRPPVSDDTSDITWDGATGKYYQIHDTVDRGGLGAITNMGYWENQNETYPNDASFGSLQGLKVRHHRFPSHRYLCNNEQSGNVNYGISELQRLGIAVTNVNLSVPQQALIKRWKIYFAKKTPTNSIFAGEDISLFANAMSNDPTHMWSTGGNWILQADNGSGWNSVSTTVKFQYMRGHSLDQLLSPGSIRPTFVQFNNRLTISDPLINQAWNGFSTTGTIADTGKTSGSLHYGDNWSAVIDYADPTVVNRAAGNRLMTIQSYNFVGQNSSYDVFKNLWTEACFGISFLAPIQSFSLSLGYGNLRTKAGDITSERLASGHTLTTSGGGTNGEEVYQITYQNLLSSVHSEYSNQELVPVEGWAYPGETWMSGPGTHYFYGGNGYLCFMSFITASPRQFAESSDGKTGVRVFRGFLGYSTHNFNYRHQLQGNVGSYYYGKTDPGTVLHTPYAGHGTVCQREGNGPTCLIDLSVDTINGIEYNTDYSYQNTNQTGIIWHPDLVDQTQEPTLIIYSPVQNEESLLQSWRTFPAANRYVMPRHKGDLINLQGIDNRNLLIHHEYSLFRTRTDLGLSTAEDNVFLRSNTLFSLQPEEIIASNTGYGGTQNRMACVLTKAGYAFVDNVQGKVFLYDGQQLQEISSNGLRNFYRDNMGVSSTSSTIIGYNYILINNPDVSNSSFWTNSLPLARPTPPNPFTCIQWTQNAGLDAETFVGQYGFDQSYSLTQNLALSAGTNYRVTYNGIFFSDVEALGRNDTLDLRFSFYDGGGALLYEKLFTAVNPTNTNVNFNEIKNFGSAVARVDVNLHLSVNGIPGSIYDIIVTGFKVEQQVPIYNTTVTTPDNPFIGDGYVIAYDEYYNRLLVTKKEASGGRSWTASYSPITTSWISYHDYFPDYMFSLVDAKLYSISAQHLYRHNVGNPGQYYGGTIYPMIIDTVQNPDPTQDKVFMAANWLTESYGLNGSLDYTDTFTHVTARSQDHTTDRLIISPFTQVDQLYQENLRNLNRVWYFNNLRDIALQSGFVTGFYNNYNLDPTKLNTNMDWFDQRKITDKYLILRLEYDNLSGNRFLMLDNNIQYRNATK